MSTVELGEITWEDDEDGRWVGALPDGPIIHLNAIGTMIAEIIGHAEGPLTLQEVVDAVQELVPDAPEGVGAIVEEFVGQLVAAGIVRVGAAAAAGAGAGAAAAAGAGAGASTGRGTGVSTGDAGPIDPDAGPST